MACGLYTLDRVNLSCETAVACAGAAKMVAGGVDDRIVVDQIQSEGTVARARVDGDGVGVAATFDRADDHAGERARSGERKVGRIDAGHVFAEADQEPDRGGLRGTGIEPINGRNDRRRFVDGADFLEAAVACAGAAEWVPVASMMESLSTRFSPRVPLPVPVLTVMV